MLEHSELVPWGPKGLGRLYGRRKLPAASQGKMKGQGTDAEMGSGCSLHSCKFWSSQRSEDIWALPLSSYMIFYKSLGFNIFFCKLRKVTKITSEVPFSRQYMALGSKWITCMFQGHHCYLSLTPPKIHSFSPQTADISQGKLRHWVLTVRQPRTWGNIKSRPKTGFG